MDMLVSIFLVLVVLGLFELAAAIFGVDSRESVGDDHQRRSEGGA